MSGSLALSIWRWPPSFGASKPPLAPQLAAKSKREALARVSESLGPRPGGVAHRFWLQSLTRISHMVRGCKGSGNCSLLICPGEGGRFAEGIMMSLPQKRGTLLSRSVTAQQTSTQGTVIPVIKAWALTTCKPSSWEEGQERLTEPVTDFEKTRRAEHGRRRQEAGRAVSSSRRWREQSPRPPPLPQTSTPRLPAGSVAWRGFPSLPTNREPTHSSRLSSALASPPGLSAHLYSSVL